MRKTCRRNPAIKSKIFGFQNTTACAILQPGWDDYELLAISRKGRFSGPIFKPANVLEGWAAHCIVAMTVDYQLDRADFLAFSKERERFAPESLSRIYYFGIVPAIGVGLAISVQSFPVAATFTTLFLVSGWFITDRIQRSYWQSTYSDENLSFSTRLWTVKLSDEGLRISSDAAEVLYRWTFIRQVSRNSRYLLFEITPLRQVHIPIRAFRDEEHIQQFMSTAKSYVKRPGA
jgi:hypothetical protein